MCSIKLQSQQFILPRRVPNRGAIARDESGFCAGNTRFWRGRQRTLGLPRLIALPA
jgi:hypothetical protein